MARKVLTCASGQKYELLRNVSFFRSLEKNAAVADEISRFQTSFTGQS